MPRAPWPRFEHTHLDHQGASRCSLLLLLVVLVVLVVELVIVLGLLAVVGVGMLVAVSMGCLGCVLGSRLEAAHDGARVRDGEGRQQTRERHRSRHRPRPH